jgi:alpha-tubulin suppressor-like RCC1 family protein
MSRRSRYLKTITALLAGALLTTCTNELEPTGAIAVTLAKGAAWPDTLAVAEIAALAVSVTGPGQQAVTGVTLEWGSTDSSVVTVTSTPTALHAQVTSLRTGEATIVVRVAQTGFAPVELRAPVVVRTRGADSLLSVGDVDTIALGLQRADPTFLAGATVTWGSSDPSVVGVAALASDSTRAVITGRFSGTAQVTATVQDQLGRSTFRLPVSVFPLEISELPAWVPTVNRTNTAAFAVQVQDALGRIRTGVKVQWHSTNETAFTVDSLGTVVGKTRGGGELVASVGVAPFQVVEHRAPLQVTEKWKAVSAGGEHTCAIAALDGTGYCWGSNAEGQLGLGFDASALAQASLPRTIATSHKFTELEAGAAHSCGREGFQTLLCWGARDRGALGDGVCIPGGMGSICFPSAESPVTIVSGGIVSGVQVRLDQLIVGGTFSCIVTVNGGSGSFTSRDVRCWGTADDFGRGIAFPGSGFADSAVILQPGLSGNADIVEVAAGGAHLCTRTDDIWWVRCMGINDHAQLGDGTVGNDPNPPWVPKDFTIVGGDPVNPGGDGYPTSGLSAGGSHTCALDAVGVLCWGSNASGQLGSAVAGDAVYPTRASLPVQALVLSAGGEHTCALVSGGDVWCWGSNSHGQLGRGTIGGTSSAPALVSGGLKFASISAASAHTCGVTTDGSLYCWGNNSSGQVGDGTLIDRATPVRVAESPQ